MGGVQSPPIILLARIEGYMYKEIFHTVLICLILFANAADASIGIAMINGNWSEPVGEPDLTGGAGSDLQGDYESASNIATIDISGTIDEADTWTVEAKLVETDWLAGLHFYVERTSAGSGTGSISGGETYLELTDTYQTFFSGSGDRSGIDVQEKVSGVSATMNIDDYSITIIYKVVETQSKRRVSSFDTENPFFDKTVSDLNEPFPMRVIRPVAKPVKKSHALKTPISKEEPIVPEQKARKIRQQ